MKFPFAGLLFLLIVVSLSLDSLAQRTQPLQHLWEVQPDLGDIWGKQLDNTSLRFDVELLGSAELQDQARTAQMICLSYNSKGFTPQLRNRAKELLIAQLSLEGLPLQLRRSMVSALALLNDDSNADFLWRVSQSDPLSRRRVERSLISWKSKVAIESWRQRLSSANASHQEIALAFDGIAVVGDPGDNSLLLQVLRGNNTSLSNRILAASTIGVLNDHGFEELAETVLASDVEQRHLIAAHLLKQHKSDKTLMLMRTIYDQGTAVAQRIAVQNICIHFSHAALELAPVFLEHEESEIRLSGLRFLQSQSDDESLKLQGALLADRNDEIRRLVGEQLVEKAKSGQKAIVDACVSDQLNGDSWAGVVQAIIVAVRLSDATRCNSFLELLAHPRPDVNMHAGWALMELAEEPEILDAIFQQLQITTKLLSAGVASNLKDTDLIRISYLHEAMGRARYEPAKSTLLKYVPKNDFKLGKVSRASAIWALGEFYDGHDNASLRQSLSERMDDFSPLLPEDYLVQFACALALGQMGFEDSVPILEKYNDGTASEKGHACTWALQEISRTSGKP